ncbi:hypothetical protein ABZ470_17470 [Streptosporangium sp. NPDC020072]|uniref:hypothetical protein n=1 Tax=Streptosporangium sp. NPDC020072 TaxID=3154788 RepID=UPI003439CEDC
MKIRRLPAALLAAALGTAVLVGAGSASASVGYQTGVSAESRAFSAFAPLPPNWYWSSRYETSEACWAGYRDAAENGDFTGLGGCRWDSGDRYRQAGYYFLKYIP